MISKKILLVSGLSLAVLTATAHSASAEDPEFIQKLVDQVVQVQPLASDKFANRTKAVLADYMTQFSQGNTTFSKHHLSPYQHQRGQPS